MSSSMSSMSFHEGALEDALGDTLGNVFSHLLGPDGRAVGSTFGSTLGSTIEWTMGPAPQSSGPVTGSVLNMPSILLSVLILAALFLAALSLISVSSRTPWRRWFLDWFLNRVPGHTPNPAINPASADIPAQPQLNTMASLRSLFHPTQTTPASKGQGINRLNRFNRFNQLPMLTGSPSPKSHRSAQRHTLRPSTHRTAGLGVNAEVEEMMAQLHRSQEALSQSEAKYRELVEHIPGVVYEADVDDVMSTTYISPVVEELLGFPARAWIRNPSFWYEHVHPEDRQKLTYVTRSNSAQRTHLTSEYRLIARNGRTIWVRDESRVIRDSQTGRVYLQGVMIDITARKEAEAQLRYVNEHDALTGLYNRAYFEDVLSRLQSEVDAQVATEAAFIIVDIHALKMINDAYGYAAGDTLLRDLADLLRACIQAHITPPTDAVVLARTAGDEFVVILTGPYTAHLNNIMVEIRQRVDAMKAHANGRAAGRQPQLSISMGSATHQPEELLTHTLQRADRALYQQKVLNRPLHALERLLGPRLNVLLSHTHGNNLSLLTHNLQPADARNASQLKELQQAEATYQQFIEQLPVTTYISLPDEQNSIMYISPQIQQILGFSPEEFLRAPDLWTRQIDSADRERVLTTCQAIYKQGTPAELEYRMVTRQGQRVFIHDEFWPIFNEQGQLSYVQGVMMDVTAQHLAEARSKAFSALGAQLSATTDVSDAADIILQVADQLLDWDAASISLSSVEDKTLLQTLLMIDTEQGHRHTVRDHESRLFPGSLLHWVLEEGKGLVLHESEIVERVTKRDLRPFGDANHPPKTVLVVPVRNGARTIGLMCVHSYKPNAYTQVDLDTLQALAGHCGGALERIWAEQMLRNQQATLQTISNAVSGRHNIRETLNDICFRVNQQLGTDATGIVLLSPDGTRLACAGSHGFYEEQIPESIPVDITHAGRAIRERRTIHVQYFQFYLPGDVASPPHSIMRSQRYQSVTHASPEPNVAYLGVPLLLNDRPVGVLELFRYVGFPTHSQWHSFLQSLAHQVAVAIDSARLVQDVQRANQELAQAYGSTIEGWSRALDMRDKETEGHSQRVTEMTVRLAKAFGFSDEQLKNVRYGALLHDIGKLAIPDHILFNVGPLSQDEWAVMRRHPEYARQMLGNVDYLKPALDIPYSHHERWDGNGYPRGLKGEEIPLAARIFAVVDVWDALRSSRRYREGLPDMAVRDYLRADAGVHLDPQVVDRFLTMLDSQAEV